MLCSSCASADKILPIRERGRLPGALAGSHRLLQESHQVCTGMGYVLVLTAILCGVLVLIPAHTVWNAGVQKRAQTFKPLLGAQDQGRGCPVLGQGVWASEKRQASSSNRAYFDLKPQGSTNMSPRCSRCSPPYFGALVFRWPSPCICSHSVSTTSCNHSDGRSGCTCQSIPMGKHRRLAVLAELLSAVQVLDSSCAFQPSWERLRPQLGCTMPVAGSY